MMMHHLMAFAGAIAVCALLSGCSMGNSAGGNLSGADPGSTRAGCGAVQVGIGAGTGNGGVCVWQPGAIGRQTIDGKTGDIDNLITGWAFNPMVTGSAVTGTPMPSTPANAGDAAAAADK